MYASVSKPPGEDKLRSSLIIIVDDKGKLVDYDQNHTIGWYYGRVITKKVRIVVKDFVKRSFGIAVKPEDVEVVKYPTANKILFKLENK